MKKIKILSILMLVLSFVSKAQDGQVDNMETLKYDLMTQGILQYVPIIDLKSNVVILGSSYCEFMQAGEPDEFIKNLATSKHIGRQLAEKFTKENSKPVRILKENFPLQFELTIITMIDYTQIFQDKVTPEAKWERFLNKFPSSSVIVKVSNLVFSSKGDSALMSIEYQVAKDVKRGCFLKFVKLRKTWVCVELLDAPTLST